MAATGSSRASKTQREICVKEELKIAVKIALDRFRFEEGQKGNADICLNICKSYYAICECVLCVRGTYVLPTAVI